MHSDSIQCTPSAIVSCSSSAKGSRQHRDASGSEETIPGPPLTHQLSQGIKSTPSNKLEDVTSKALQEQLDKEIPVAPLTALLKMICKMNAPEWWMIGLGLIGSMVAGAIIPLFSIFFGRIVSVFANPPEKVFPLVHPWAGLFLALATVTALATFMKVALFTISGERLTLRLRSETFHAILKQEIGWFDDQRNSTGALVTRLTNDTAQVAKASGTSLGTLLETSFGLLLALIIAFVHSWISTIMILILVPVMMAAGLLQVKVLTGHAVGYKKALENAGKLAVDSIQNIHTVASLGIEESFAKSYETESRKPYL